MPTLIAPSCTNGRAGGAPYRPKAGPRRTFRVAGRRPSATGRQDTAIPTLHTLRRESGVSSWPRLAPLWPWRDPVKTRTGPPEAGNAAAVDISMLIHAL